MRICQVKKPPGGRRRGTATEERRERKPEGIRDLNATKGGKCTTPISVLNPSPVKLLRNHALRVE